MIDRYLIKEIQQLWTDDHKIDVWAQIEELVCEGWAEIGVIPKQDIISIKKNIKVNRQRMLEIEQETKHDVVAFTRMLSESLGDEKKWIHLGITSTDIVDTTQNYLVKQSSVYVWNYLNNLKKTLMDLAQKYKHTLIMGRTHGIYGEPTSLGLEFLLWHEEILRQEKRLKLAFDDVCVTKISGSMGNYANLEISVEEYVAKKLEMPRDNLSTQVSQRDRLASLFLVFANLSTTFEKIVTEIRLFQRSEVKEMMEGFSANQKGSSSMPHKKNPISSENVTGLSRLIRSYVIPSLENNVLWHQRDISHSSNERIMLPDVLNLVCYVVNRLNDILKNLVVDEQQMLQHIKDAKEVYFSQPLMTNILMHSNASREEIYDFIQKCSLQVIQRNCDFRDVLVENDVYQYINQKDFDKVFSLQYFLRNVDEIYRKVNKN